MITKRSVAWGRLLVLFAALLLSSCDDSRDAKDILVVGMSGDFPPFMYQKDGKLVGHDVDLAEKVAEKMNRELVVEKISFQNLIESLTSREIDLVISAMSIDPVRAEEVDFSHDYYEASVALIVPVQSQVSNLQNSRSIGVFGSSILRKLLGQFRDEHNCSFEVVEFSNNLSAMNAMLSGDVDGVISELPNANAMAAMFPEKCRVIDLRKDGFDIQRYGIALTKGSELLPEVNKIVDDLKSTGYLQTLDKKWGVGE